MSITAIETRYRGYRFRSRLEARWAVFFDSLGIKWEYEPQGYKVGVVAKKAYLPDFFLPATKTWVEVKGDCEAINRWLLSLASGPNGLPYMGDAMKSHGGGLLILGPIPDLDQDHHAPIHPILKGDENDYSHSYIFPAIFESEGMIKVIKAKAFGRKFHNAAPLGDIPFAIIRVAWENQPMSILDYSPDDVVAAYDEARGARFEHEERR